MDCCEVWKEIKGEFQWYIINSGSEGLLRVMPCIVTLNNYKWRVNYCPSCGADVREVEEGDDL